MYMIIINYPIDFSYIFLAAYSLIDSSCEDEFEIQFSVGVVDDLVFPPAWLAQN